MSQIIIKSPITSNGINPVLDSKGQIRYKETIVEASAEKNFLKMNEKLPQHLKRIIEPFNAKKEVKAAEPVISEVSAETKPKVVKSGKK